MLKNKVVLISILLSILLVAGLAVWQLKLFPFKSSFKGVFEEGSHVSPTPSSSTTPTTRSPAKTPTPTPKPKSIRLIPDKGTQGTYQISQGTHQGPSFTQVIFNPLDAQKNQTLTITVSLKIDSPADQVTGNLQMDNSQADLSFQKVSTDAQTENWQAKILLKDSVLYKYILTVTAKNSAGSSTINVAPRS